jgi:1,2-diacylglycerol 3-beta-galactosyltransferase
VARILLLMADAGGGHRSCAEAVLESLDRRVGESHQVEMKELMHDYTPFPLNRAERVYDQMVRFSQIAWAPPYELTNTPDRVRQVVKVLWPLVQQGAREAIRDCPADLIISFYPLYNYALLWAQEKENNHTPMATVITDMATYHAMWCPPGMVRYMVPTEQAARVACGYGVSADQIDITGLPISRRFAELSGRPKPEVRRNLDLEPDLPMVLLMGGGQGMGRVYETARALASVKANFQLVVVAGRNPQLKRQLHLANWKIPTRVLGFTREIPVLMAAADILVSKAGPSTIAEGMAMGLPMIINGYIPGQEAGNMRIVVRSKAGVYTPEPKKVAQTVREWLEPGSTALSEYAEASRKMGRPEAADNVADLILKLAEQV